MPAASSDTIAAGTVLRTSSSRFAVTSTSALASTYRLVGTPSVSSSASDASNAANAPGRSPIREHHPAVVVCVGGTDDEAVGAVQAFRFVEVGETLLERTEVEREHAPVVQSLGPFEVVLDEGQALVQLEQRLGMTAELVQDHHPLDVQHPELVPVEQGHPRSAARHALSMSPRT